MAGPPTRDAEAYERLERLRWGAGPSSCPHCSGTGRCYVLRPRDGSARRTRTGAPTARRLWKCGGCRRQFSVLTGTVLAGSRLPAGTLLAVLTDWGREGRPTAAALAARHGMTPEAARHLLQRVDAALDGSSAEPLTAVFAPTPAQAAAIRWRTPARRRPRPQVGPAADYGTG